MITGCKKKKKKKKNLLFATKYSLLLFSCHLGVGLGEAGDGEVAGGLVATKYICGVCGQANYLIAIVHPAHAYYTLQCNKHNKYLAFNARRSQEQL